MARPYLHSHMRTSKGHKVKNEWAAGTGFPLTLTRDPARLATAWPELKISHANSK